MVSRDEMAKRLANYVDNEIMPRLDTKGKWAIGTYMTLALYRMHDWVDSILKNPMLSALGLEDENGMIHTEIVIDALEKNAQKFGKLSIQIPLLGTMTFSCDDVHKLGEYLT